MSLLLEPEVQLHEDPDGSLQLETHSDGEEVDESAEMLEDFSDGILSVMEDRASNNEGVEELEEFLEMKPGANPVFEYTCNLCQLTAASKSGKFYHKVRRPSNLYYPCDMCKFVEETLESLTKQKRSVTVTRSNKDHSSSSSLPQSRASTQPSGLQPSNVQGVSILSVMGNYRGPERESSKMLKEKTREITPLAKRPGESLLKPVVQPTVQAVPKLSTYRCTECDFIATSVKILVRHMDKSHITHIESQVLGEKKKEKKDKSKSYPISLIPLKDAQLATMEKDPLEAIGVTEQQTAESMDTHMKEYGINIDGEDMVALLNCPECSFTTPEPAELRIHVENQHPGERFACELCNFFATRKSTLKTHYASIHEGIRFPCELCKYAATQKSALRRHMKTVHNPHKLYKYQRNYSNYEKYQDMSEKTVLIDKVPENSFLLSGPVLSSPVVIRKENASASPPRSVSILWKS